MGTSGRVRQASDGLLHPQTTRSSFDMGECFDLSKVFTQAIYTAFPAAELVLFWGGVQQGFDGFKHNPTEYARSVKCPVLMMQGKRDTRVTLEKGRSIFENLGGEKRFEIFDVAHEVMAVTRPEECRSV